MATLQIIYFTFVAGGRRSYESRAVAVSDATQWTVGACLVSGYLLSRAVVAGRAYG